MTKHLHYCLLVIAILLGMTSCSTETDDDANYNLGFAALYAESENLTLETQSITDAFVAEFGGESFTLKGGANDKSVIERFNKVANSYVVSPTFVGYIDYVVSRNGKTLAKYRFENHYYYYDIAWSDTGGNFPVAEYSAIQKTFATALGADVQGDFSMHAANFDMTDAKVKEIFEQTGKAVVLTSGWKGFAILTAERHTPEGGVEVASYRFEQ